MNHNGETFLRLSRATEFTIAFHALDRMRERVGFRPAMQSAHVWFKQSRQISYDDMNRLGYRPNYTGRQRNGKPSWYFRFQFKDEEMVAVVSEGSREGEYVWLTTYGRDQETNHFRRLAE